MRVNNKLTILIILFTVSTAYAQPVGGVNFGGLSGDYAMNTVKENESQDFDGRTKMARISQCIAVVNKGKSLTHIYPVHTQKKNLFQRLFGGVSKGDDCTIVSSSKLEENKRLGKLYGKTVITASEVEDYLESKGANVSSYPDMDDDIYNERIVLASKKGFIVKEEKDKLDYAMVGSVVHSSSTPVGD